MRTPTFDQDEAVSLLRRLVAVRSYPGEEGEAQQVVAGWLKANGLTPELQPTPNGQPNVIARVENGPGPTLLLNGHTDTVLAVEGWACDPWQGRLEGERFSALGAGDMKVLGVLGLATNWQVAIWTAIFSLVWGALLGVFKALLEGKGLALLNNTLNVLNRQTRPETQHYHRIPYTVALLLGWATFVSMSLGRSL